MHFVLLAKLLVLVSVANGIPVIAKKLLKNNFNRPLDGGATFVDGRPIFGHSKTLRGLILAVAFTSLCAPILALDWRVGAIIGMMAMAGDLFSSFLKRRINLAPSSQAFGLDQIPESLFALIAVSGTMGLSVGDIALGVVVFLIGEIIVSRLLFALHIRDRPY